MAKYFIQHCDIDQVCRNMRKTASREQYYVKRYNHFISRSKKRRLAREEQQRRFMLRLKREKMNSNKRS